MNTHYIERLVAAFVDERVPSLQGGRCVLAASGGADSTAMVAVLVEAGIVRRDDALVAHFDHRLRGEQASTRDRAAVEALCARYGLLLAVDAWDAPRVGEAAARNARYTALAGIAAAHDARVIVTGHTADDQAETVVMHALRGAGLHGLAGMAPDAPHPSSGALRVARPLLAVRRDQTRAYCAARGLAYEDDASNESLGPLRNRVRHEVLPAMARGMPDVRAALVELAATARAASDALDAAAATLVPLRPDDGAIAIAREVLTAAPAELVPHAFRRAVVRLVGDAREFERKHYAALARAVHTTGVTVMLPRGLVLTVDADAVRLSRGPLVSPAIEAGFSAALPFEGTVGAWSLRIVPAGDASLAQGGVEVRLPEGAVVRARAPGDRVRVPAGGKKLGDWYTDRKIPRRDREAAPVIAWGQQVFWTPFGALGELPHGRPWRIIGERAAGTSRC
jgi:tRNA(Ile)-lysidine synthase